MSDLKVGWVWMKSGLWVNEKPTMSKWQADYERMKSRLWANEKRTRIDRKADYDWRSWWVDTLLDTSNLHFECIKQILHFILSVKGAPLIHLLLFPPDCWYSFALGIVVCSGFGVSSVGSWSFFRVFICFCAALLFHVLSSTVLVVWCVLWAVFRGCICL